VTTEETPVEYKNEVVDTKEAADVANERGVFVPWPKKVTIPLCGVSQPFSDGDILFVDQILGTHFKYQRKEFSINHVSFGPILNKTSFLQ